MLCKLRNKLRFGQGLASARIFAPVTLTMFGASLVRFEATAKAVLASDTLTATSHFHVSGVELGRPLLGYAYGLLALDLITAFFITTMRGLTPVTAECLSPKTNTVLF
jgi:hypothetical protein